MDCQASITYSVSLPQVLRPYFSRHPGRGCDSPPEFLDGEIQNASEDFRVFVPTRLVTLFPRLSPQEAGQVLAEREE